MAAAAEAKVFPTERGRAQHLVLTTGRSAAGSDAPEWGAVAAPGVTLCYYMGVAEAGRIAAELIKGGAPTSCEASVVERAGLPGARRFVTNLSELPALMRREEVRNPAIITITWPLSAEAEAALDGEHQGAKALPEDQADALRRAILLAAPRLLAESYAGPALAKIRGLEAHDELVRFTMQSPARRSREGAAYGLAHLGTGEAAAAIIDAAVSGAIGYQMGGVLVERKNLHDLSGSSVASQREIYAPHGGHGKG